jgi:hypothetical protein
MMTSVDLSPTDLCHKLSHYVPGTSAIELGFTRARTQFDKEFVLEVAVTWQAYRDPSLQGLL